MAYTPKTNIGLKWIVYPKHFQGKEAFTGADVTLLGTSVLNAETLESNSNTTDGFLWPFSPNLVSINNALTIIVGAEIDSKDDSGVLWSTPARGYNDAWQDPWAGLSFGAWSSQPHLLLWSGYGATTAQGFDEIRSGDFNDTSTGNELANLNGSYHQYAVTAGTSNTIFYKDGQITAQKAGLSAAVNFHQQQAVTIFSHGNSGSQVEGVNGRVRFAAVFNRVLTATEIAAIFADPEAALLDSNIVVSPPPPPPPAAEPLITVDATTPGTRIQRGIVRGFVVVYNGVASFYAPGSYGEMLRGLVVRYMDTLYHWHYQQFLENRERNTWTGPSVLETATEDQSWYENAEQRAENTEKLAELQTRINEAYALWVPVADELRYSVLPGTWRRFPNIQHPYLFPNYDKDPLGLAVLGFFARDPAKSKFISQPNIQVKVDGSTLLVEPYTP